MKQLAAVLLAVLALAGCATKPEIARSDDELRAAAYVHDGPPEITLFTMRAVRNEAGAHSALMVNASQRVIFDPAGSFRNQSIIRRGDVIYGAHPPLVDVFTRFHARETFYVERQRLPVSPQLAQALLRAVQANGRVSDAQCALSISRVLAQFPEFGITPTWYPNALSEQFARIPGVQSDQLYEYDSDDNSAVLEAYDAVRARAAQ